MKNYFVIFIVLGIIFLYQGKISNYITLKKRELEIKTTLSKYPLFYSSLTIKNLKIDSFFLLQELLRLTENKKIILDDTKYKNNLFNRLLSKENGIDNITLTRTKNNDYTVPKEYTSNIVDQWDGILLKALYCDKTGYDAHDFSLLQTLDHHDGGYYDTHFLIGLLFLESNNCYDSAVIKNSKEEIVKVITEAQTKDTSYTDLYSERVVVLYWAGYGESVKGEWIDIILRNFDKDISGWRTNNISYLINPHATGLSFLSLIYYTEGKAKQPFY